MRILVVGASGALGSRLVPQLIDAGHDVIGAHHAPESAGSLRTVGAKPVPIDLLDARAVRKAALEAEPAGHGWYPWPAFVLPVNRLLLATWILGICHRAAP
jgi:nucleoside-diphosphate-sugar epimerase